VIIKEMNLIEIICFGLSKSKEVGDIYNEGSGYYERDCLKIR